MDSPLISMFFYINYYFSMHFLAFPGQQAEQEAAASAFASESTALPGTAGIKRRTLEDLFRPPIDLLHKGSFESVSHGSLSSFSYEKGANDI